MTSLTSSELRHLPDKMLAQIIHTIQTFPNETVDFSRPIVRRTLRGSYPLFITIYCLLALAGAVANSALLARLFLARHFYSDPTCVYVMNLGVCNLLASLVLLPLSLVVLLLQNWVLGSVMCYLLPMLQDVPIHATMATFVVISADRHRKIASPLEPRVSASTAVAGIWVAALSVVLPYVMYVNYIDLQVMFGRQFDGVGICTLNLNDNIALYIRLLYGLLYVVPLLLVIYFHLRVSHEIDRRVSDREDRCQPSLEEGELTNRIWTVRGRTATVRNDVASRGTFHGEAEECQLDLEEEKRSQTYLALIIGISTLCLTPLAVLRLVKNEILETRQNSGHFDITYITFVWVAFLPAVSTPVVFAAWKYKRWDSRQNQLPSRACSGQEPRAKLFSTNV
ncbi:orexin receptor type 1-like isoform X2 [Penaeus monodon]|uniref:orexin receptor type 1-like isoform X2 n=1 Tax=Penaeus monodon TaxID=6687 RepID=UPI0018A7868B|nr:orexin receptor type 1-like isoform X2 [Penaeus monodon]